MRHHEPAILQLLYPMNKFFPLFIALCAFTLLFASCAKKDSQSAATNLEKVFKPSSASVGAPSAQPAQVEQQIAKAVTSIRQQSYGEAFVTLRAAQGAPNITVDQYSAIETARLAVEREVAAKAAAGDPAALKALKTIQHSH